jgi:hypothetical protein
VTGSPLKLRFSARKYAASAIILLRRAESAFSVFGMLDPLRIFETVQGIVRLRAQLRNK